METGTKVALGLTGLAAVGATTVYYVKRGRVPHIKPDTGSNVKTKVQTLTDEARKIYDDFNSRYEEVVDSHWLDNKIFDPENAELSRLNREYKKLEKLSDYKRKLGEHLKQKPIDTNLGDTIDTRLGTRTMDAKTRADMQEFYAKMEEEAAEQARILAEKQAKKEAMLKLKEENPQEYARLKSERLQMQKAQKAQSKAQELEKNTVICENANGIEVKRVKLTNKDGSITIRDFTPDGKKLLSEVHNTPDIRVKTIYQDDVKMTIINNQNENTTVQKFYAKNKDGNYELVQKEIINIENNNIKTVSRLEDGNTQIVDENKSRKIVTIRDKKGNILSEETYIKKSGAPKPPEPPTQKVLATWYVNYLKLCKKYGQTPRICGVKGGAWDHFYELCLRDTDKEAYNRYLRLRAYRARYDEKAAILESLDKGVLKPEMLETIQKENPEIDISEKLVEQIKIAETNAQRERQRAQQGRRQVLVYA